MTVGSGAGSNRSPRSNALTICHNLLVCGRYRLSRRKQMIEEYFGSVSSEDDWNPRYNIAPTQSVPVIRRIRRNLAGNCLCSGGDSSRPGQKTHQLPSR
jgi:putative SOS response-associated peptidase YedK